MAVSPAKMSKGKISTLSGTEAWWHLNKNYDVTGEQMVNMKQATIPAIIDGEPGTLVRIFDSTAEKKKGVTIADYVSLNDHPNLVLYEGYFVGRGRARKAVIEPRDSAAGSSIDKKIQEGAITQVGVIKKKTGGEKFLTFLTMGGFLVIIVVIVGIVIAAQTCGK